MDAICKLQLVKDYCILQTPWSSAIHARLLVLSSGSTQLYSPVNPAPYPKLVTSSTHARARAHAHTRARAHTHTHTHTQYI